jgi:molybdopterin-guanine dinucleotide biosynthesis protein A
VGAPAAYCGLGYRVVPDLHPGEGPLGGILTALADSEAEWNLVVACDLPEIDAEFLGALAEVAERSQSDAVVPVHPGAGCEAGGAPHQWEPLCAAWGRGARPGLEAAFAEGVRKMAVALERVRTVPFAADGARFLHNVNTPEEWAYYAAE